MKKSWPLQEVKNRLSAIIDEALQNGPQIITRRGVETAVLISFKDYTKITKPKEDLISFLKSSPLYGEEIDLKRTKDIPREVEL